MNFTEENESEFLNEDTLKLTHGTTMIVSWAILTFISVLAVRYVHPKERGLQIHRQIQQWTSLFVILAASTIFYYRIEEGSTLAPRLTHHYLGLTIITLSFIETITGMISMLGTHSLRDTLPGIMTVCLNWCGQVNSQAPYFEIPIRYVTELHRVIGIITMILVWIQIPLGMDLTMYAPALPYGYLAYLIIVLGVLFTLEARHRKTHHHIVLVRTRTRYEG